MLEALPALVNDLALIEVIVGIGHAVNTALNDKLMQMIIVPVHDDLQYAMQLGQSCVFPHLDATPDRRMNVPQRHFKLIQQTILFWRHDYTLIVVANMRRTDVRPMWS